MKFGDGKVFAMGSSCECGAQDCGVFCVEPLSRVRGHRLTSV